MLAASADRFLGVFLRRHCRSGAIWLTVMALFGFGVATPIELFLDWINPRR